MKKTDNLFLNTGRPDRQIQKYLIKVYRKGNKKKIYIYIYIYKNMNL